MDPKDGGKNKQGFDVCALRKLQWSSQDEVSGRHPRGRIGGMGKKVNGKTGMMKE